MTSAKHYIAYEQEHFRQLSDAITYGFNITESGSANLDDVTMHELYLWPFAGKFTNLSYQSVQCWVVKWSIPVQYTGSCAWMKFDPSGLYPADVRPTMCPAAG